MIENTIRSILYVCTGNVYRSPVAEEMTRQLLGNLDIRVESAGVTDYNGKPLRKEILELTKIHGIDISSHRPRQVNADLVNSADLILVFDNSHIKEMEEMFPKAKNKTVLIKDYSGYYDNPDMEDLWGKPPEEFEKFITQLKVYVQGCVNRIKP